MGCSYTAPFQIVFIIYQKIVKSVTETAAEIFLIVLYYVPLILMSLESLFSIAFPKLTMSLKWLVM